MRFRLERDPLLEIVPVKSLQAGDIDGEGELPVSDRKSAEGIELAQHRIVSSHDGTPVDTFPHRTRRFGSKRAWCEKGEKHDDEPLERSVFHFYPRLVQRIAVLTGISHLG